MQKIGKYKMEIIAAHNGAEVIHIKSTEYVHTKYDKIMSDWRNQERIKRQKAKKSKSKIINIFRKIPA